jgi:hypothetical protein
MRQLRRVDIVRASLPRAWRLDAISTDTDCYRHRLTHAIAVGLALIDTCGRCLKGFS